MANRRKKGREVSGWLSLDKRVGETSTSAVAAVKRLFDAAKAGHAGTLDPLASGCLPIALGDATKTVPFVQDGRKAYRFTVRWGAETDTDDADGAVIGTSENRPGREELIAALPEFCGEIMQRPPAYSALKIGGERAYDLAREGTVVELAERPVTIHSLLLVAQPDRDHAVLEAECGKGTYVRAVARDLARRLGTLGHIAALRRTSVGPFTEDTLLTIDDLIAAREAGPVQSLDRLLKPVSFGLVSLPEVALASGDAARVRRGQSVLIRGRDAPLLTGMVHATSAGESVAIGEIAEGAFHPKRVFGA